MRKLILAAAALAFVSQTALAPALAQDKAGTTGAAGTTGTARPARCTACLATICSNFR